MNNNLNSGDNIYCNKLHYKLNKINKTKFNTKYNKCVYYDKDGNELFKSLHILNTKLIVTRHYPNGDIYTGEFKNNLANGKGTLKSANGSIYKGPFKNGFSHGYGMKIYNNGCEYIGNFKEGLRDGNGLITLLDGMKYSGQFKNDLLHGFGELKFANGTYYKGQFIDNKRHGSGKLYDNNDKLLFDGTWHDNSAINGILYFNDKISYQGSIYNGLPHGKGKYTNNLGYVYEGEFNNGYPIGGGKIMISGTK